MNKSFASSFTSTLRALALGAAAMFLAMPAASAKSGTGLGGTGVVYSVPQQIVQGNMPLTTSYTLQITSPSNLPLGLPSLVTLNVSLLTAPSNIAANTALSFVTITPLQQGLLDGTVASLPILSQIASAAPVLTFTGPNQTISVTVNINIPNGNWAGSFGYEIMTTGWGVTATDPGAFINVTATVPPTAAGPVITINQPVNQTVYSEVANTGPITIPYVFVGSTVDGSPLTTMNGTVSYTDLNGNPVTQDLGVEANATGFGSPNATSTGSFQASAPGVYTITANDANAVGNATASVQVTVQIVAGPPSVTINTPDPGSSYVMTGNEVDVPMTFTGTSQYGGVVTLTATLDGTPLNVTTSGIGNLVANGSATLALTSTGDHVINVTCTDNFGTATANETITVTVQAPQPPPTVVINTPAPNAQYTYTTGGPALNVPFTFTGSSTGGPITQLTATLDGSPITFSTSGLNTQTATGSTNLTFTSGGNHTLAVTATNNVGTASTSEVISIITQGPQASTLNVAITKPAPNSTYTLSSGGCPLVVPDAFVSNSTATSGVTSLKVSFNGTPVSVTTSTLGKPSVTANGSLVLTNPGVYTLSVTATDQNGSATASENITVAAPTPVPQITIVKPCDGAQYTVGTSSCPLWVQVAVSANTTPGSTLSNLTLTLNGQPVTFTTTKGVGTTSANGTVSIQISSTGTYTLVATTSAGGVVATDTNTFKVVPPSGCGYNGDSGWGNGSGGWCDFGGWGSYNNSGSWGNNWGGNSWGGNSYGWGGYSCNYTTPTPCNVNWQQSWSCNTTQHGGSSLPVCFQVQYTGSNCTNYWNSYFKSCGSDYYNEDCNSRNSWGSYGYVNCLYGNVPSSSNCLNNNWCNVGGNKCSNDNSVQVVCYPVYSNGSCGSPTVYSCTSKTNTCKINNNCQYSCNFQTQPGTHTYRCDVYYTNKSSGQQCFLGSEQFCTR